MTRAVLECLALRSLDTVVLNVAVSNTAAIRVYDRLGFRSCCRYHEIVAVPR